MFCVSLAKPTTAAEHIEAEGAAEAVDPLLPFGRREAHPRAGVGEPTIAAVQGVGSVGDVQYVGEGIPFLRSAFHAGSAGCDACGQQCKAEYAYKFVFHMNEVFNGYLCACSAASSSGARGASVKLYFHSCGVMVYSG